MSVYERRRVLVAAVVTLVALPALWWAKRDHPISDPGVAAVDAGGGLAAFTGSRQLAGDVDTPATPGYLSGPRSDVPDTTAAPSGPPVEESFTRAGEATYRTFANDPRPTPKTTDAKASRSTQSTVVAVPYLCELGFLPTGTRVTVENTDNGNKVTCLVRKVRKMPDGLVLVMDTSLFVELSDLPEAPIPVRIRW